MLETATTSSFKVGVLEPTEDVRQVVKNLVDRAVVTNDHNVPQWGTKTRHGKQTNTTKNIKQLK